MAVKTITIDMDAYALLKRHKKKAQSFSQVIKEHFASSKGSALLNVLAELNLSEETLDAIDGEIANRESDLARSADL